MRLEVNLPRGAIGIPYKGSAQLIGVSGDIAYAISASGATLAIDADTGVITGDLSAVAYGTVVTATVTATYDTDKEIEVIQKFSVGYPQPGDAGYTINPVTDAPSGATLAELRPDSPASQKDYNGGALLADVESISTLPATANLDLSNVQTQQLSTTGTYSDGTSRPIGNSTPTYTTSDDAIATVSASGLVTPTGVGSATITVTVGTKTDTVAITVVA